MSRVRIFSTQFPKGHPKAGERTRFLEKIYACLAHIKPMFQIPNTANAYWDWHEYYNCRLPKRHTVRGGHHFVPGDVFSPRIWSGKPHRSNQITFADDIEVQKVWDFFVEPTGATFVNGKHVLIGDLNTPPSQTIIDIAHNDGLSFQDFIDWIILPVYMSGKAFDGQIICWDQNVNYQV